MKNSYQDFYPVALTISASDSGGGSGIQADLRTFNAAGVFGCSVVTAVVARNPRQVMKSAVMPFEIVASQLQTVLDSMAVRAVKLGMAGNGVNIKAVVSVLKSRKIPLIVDSGAFTAADGSLLCAEELEIVKNELLPLADLIILNTAEAQWLLNRKTLSQSDCVEAVLQLAEHYGCNVMIEGSPCGSGKHICDIAAVNNKVWSFSMPALEDLSEFAAHGCSCTLSAGITAMIALENNWKDALRAAKTHVYGALCETARIGKELEGMYPPLEDYSSQISVRCLSSNDRGKK